MGILYFIIGLSFLILVHEFGHFIAARRAGIRVEEFGLGFPPRLFGIKKGGTIYSINLLPLGGFVKIYGEQGEDSDNKESFAGRPIWIRTIIVAAGVLMNIAVGFVLLAAVFMSGVPSSGEDGDAKYVKDITIRIVEVAKGSPAANANIRSGDIPLAMGLYPDLKGISSIQEFQDLTKVFAGKEITIRIQRGEEILEKKIIPRENPPTDEGPLGVALSEAGTARYPWYLAIYKAFVESFYIFFLIFGTLFKILFVLITTGKMAFEPSGPIGIAVMSSQASSIGINYFLYFIALISLNLAALNIFPFPALDGGRILFFLIEKIKGSPVSRRAENLVHTFGFAILIGIIILISIHDVQRYI